MKDISESFDETVCEYRRFLQLIFSQSVYFVIWHYTIQDSHQKQDRFLLFEQVPAGKFIGEKIFNRFNRGRYFNHWISKLVECWQSSRCSSKLCNPQKNKDRRDKKVWWGFVNFLDHAHFILEMLINLSHWIYKLIDKNQIDSCLFV